MADVLRRHGRLETMTSFFQAAGHYDAQLYGAFVAVFVPLIGSVYMDPMFKLYLATVFFAVGHAYWWIEVGWITAEIRRQGTLDTDDVTYQRKTMYWLYYGVIFAVVVWLLAWALGLPYPSYGVVEWMILVHTFIVARGSISTINVLFDQYLHATAMQQRYEQTTH